jgi:hypothetical protein
MNSKHISSNGQFASKRAGKSKRWVIWFIAILLIGFVGWGQWVKFTENSIPRAVQGVTKAVIKEVKAEVKPNYEENIKKEKKAILDDLSIGCETKGIKDPNGTIIFDSNNEASIGAFQYQRKTVIYYVKVFENRVITNSEAIAIAIDPIKARTLAEKILFLDEGKSEGNWYTCAKKMNIEQRVKDIKKFESI